MNTRYTVTRNGIYWDVRRPNGKRVHAYMGGIDAWERAVHQAHRLATLDQIREEKWAQPQQEPIGTPAGGWKAFMDAMNRAARLISGPDRQPDYALAR